MSESNHLSQQPSQEADWSRFARPTAQLASPATTSNEPNTLAEAPKFASAIPAVPPNYGNRYYNIKQPDVPPPPPPNAEGEWSRPIAKNHSKRSEWVWVVAALSVFIVVIVVSLGAFLIRRTFETQPTTLPNIVISPVAPTAIAMQEADTGANSTQNLIGTSLAVPGGDAIELVPWDGTSRFTMVVAGLDRREGETGLSYRTDTMMLISLDPTTNRIGVLSIPRDLYIELPGYAEMQRINTPLFFGEVQQTGYGPTLLMQTVQYNLGIRVNDFLLVDFRAFIDFIDLIGGVDVTTTYDINDPDYPDLTYGYDPFYLPAGQHHLDGYDTLRFVRTRHGDSDVQRAERQQQIIYAIREKLLQGDALAHLVAQSPALWSSLDDNIYTGLTLQQVIQLGLFARNVPLENIHTGTIGFDYSQQYITPRGEDVLIPDRLRLPNLMTRVFGADYAQ